jgi:hypothetical protein
MAALLMLSLNPARAVRFIFICPLHQNSFHPKAERVFAALILDLTVPNGMGARNKLIELNWKVLYSYW